MVSSARRLGYGGYAAGQVATHVTARERQARRLVASWPARQGTAAVCPEAPWGLATVSIRAPATGTLAIEDTDARVLAATTPPRPDST